MSIQYQKTSTYATATLKFLCSYGGKILPRPSDGKLRYVGGHTRVLSVDRSVSLSELMVKLEELCGNSVTMRCQFPNEDMDMLVTIKSDEDLANVIEEYDRISSISARDLKIRAILSLTKSLKYYPTPSSSSSSTASSVDRSPTKSSTRSSSRGSGSATSKATPVRRISPPTVGAKYNTVNDCYYPCNLQADSRLSANLVHHPNFWHF
ncbi:hypothetical protein Ancab_035817 [Ancistrocladus abbreviatus]